MHRFLNFIRAARGLMLFFLLLVIALACITFSDTSILRACKALSLSLVSLPLRTMSWSLNLGSHDTDYRELKKICLKLALENSNLKEMEKENIRLRKLLHFKERSNYDYFPVEVIGRDPNIINNTMIVQGGQNIGIKADMPAVVAEGLVGKVVDVGWNTSVVELLLDQNARVSAIDQRSRELGIIEWYRANLCRLKNIEKTDDVQVGDVIITSGMGGIYPKGLDIGKVIKVDDSGPELFKEVIVDLNVDFSYLEEIFILRLN